MNPVLRRQRLLRRGQSTHGVRRNLLAALVLWCALLAFFPVRGLLRRLGGNTVVQRHDTHCDARGFDLDAVNGERKVARLHIDCFIGAELTEKTLEGVAVTLFPRQGAPVEIHATRGTLVQGRGVTLKLRDGVTLDWQGAHLAGDTLFYKDDQDGGQIRGEQGITGTRGEHTLRSPFADFNLAEHRVSFPAGLELTNQMGGKLTALSGRYLAQGGPDGKGEMQLERSVHGALPEGMVETEKLIERGDRTRTQVILPAAFKMTDRDGALLTAASGDFSFVNGELAGATLLGGAEPVRYKHPKPAELSAPRMTLTRDPSGLLLRAENGARLDAPQEPRLRLLTAPVIEGHFHGGALERAAFSGGGNASGPAGELSAPTGDYEFAGGLYKLSGGAQVKRAADQLAAQTISGDLGGNAVAEGAVSGRRGAGAGVWRFTGARAVMKAAGPVTLTAPEGSLAQGVHGADTIRARSLTVDPEKKNYQAAGAVELHQDLPLRRALAAGETLEVNEIGGVGLMTGAVALDLFERAAETLPFLPSFKARGNRADMKLKDGQLTQVVLSSPDHSPVFCESPAYRVSGQQITYRLLEGAGEVTAAPPARVTVLNLENHQTLYGNRAEIRNAGKEVIITSAQGARTRKDTAGTP